MHPRSITMSQSFGLKPPRDYTLSVTFVIQAGAIRLGEALVHDGKDWISLPLFMFEALRDSDAIAELITRDGDAIRAEWAEASEMRWAA